MRRGAGLVEPDRLQDPQDPVAAGQRGGGEQGAPWREEVVAGAEAVDVLEDLERDDDVVRPGPETDPTPVVHVRDDVGRRPQVEPGVAREAPGAQRRPQPPLAGADLEDARAAGDRGEEVVELLAPGPATQEGQESSTRSPRGAPAGAPERTRLGEWTSSASSSS